MQTYCTVQLVGGKGETELSCWPADTHHSNSFTVEHLIYIHDNVVSYIGQDVDHCDNGHGNTDGQWQIPMKDKKEELELGIIRGIHK